MYQAAKYPTDDLSFLSSRITFYSVSGAGVRGVDESTHKVLRPTSVSENVEEYDINAHDQASDGLMGRHDAHFSYRKQHHQ